MKKIFLPIFLMLTTPFVFSQPFGFSQNKSSQEAKEVKEVVNQFLSALFKRDLTRENINENINKYVEPLTFKPVITLENYFFGNTSESEESEEFEEFMFLDFIFMMEIMQFRMEKYSFKIEKGEKVNNYEYLVQVSFRFPSSKSFYNRMQKYLDNYVRKESLRTRQSLTTIKEKEDLRQFIPEGLKEFQKLPLEDCDFEEKNYTFKVAKDKSKNKFKIVFTSDEDIDNFQRALSIEEEELWYFFAILPSIIENIQERIFYGKDFSPHFFNAHLPLCFFSR